MTSVILSPPDDRDYTIDRVAGSIDLPKTYRIDSPVLSQRGPSCVANSLACNRNAVESKQLGQPFRACAGWMYGNRLNSDWLGPGMVPRQAIKRLKADGVPPENPVWPWGLSEIAMMEYVDSLKPTMLQDALPHRITAYAQLYTMQEIKTAVYRLGPVLVVYPIGNWEIPGNVMQWTHPQGRDYGPINDLHAMTVVGWTEQHLIVQNSWGEYWGDGGRFYVPMDEDYFPLEAWALTDNIMPEVWELENAIVCGVIDIADARANNIRALSAALGDCAIFLREAPDWNVSPDIAKAKAIYLCGGPDEQVKNAAPLSTIHNLSGADRYETAAKVLDQINKIRR